MRNLLKTFFVKKNILFLEGSFAFLLFSHSVFAAPPALQVSGNKLQTSSGCSVPMRGVDADGLEFSPTGYGPSGGTGGSSLQVVQEAVTGWHCNIIRLPLNQDYWFGCGNSRVSNP